VTWSDLSLYALAVMATIAGTVVAHIFFVALFGG
jgi:hypothetical protein